MTDDDAITLTCAAIDKLCRAAEMPVLTLPPGFVTVRQYHQHSACITEDTAKERLNRGVKNGVLRKIVVGTYRNQPVYAYGPV